VSFPFGTPSPSGSAPDRRHSLLELAPELGDRLADTQLGAARSAVRVRVARVPRGRWNAAESPTAAADGVTLLILAGVAAREVAVDGSVSSELLGPGDLIAPWVRSPEHGAAGQSVRWQILADLRVAVIDGRAVEAICAFPEIQQALLARALAQSERLASIKAFSQVSPVERRLLALFRHLATRWGRVTTRGIVVPLALSHRLLGELVGARRPTVTLAIAALAQSGELTRRADGTWLMPTPSQDDGTPHAMPVVQHRRRLLVQDSPLRGGRP
jgi:CRP/FNR family transcriptional regulator, cyclic AMP receptor protein